MKPRSLPHDPVVVEAARWLADQSNPPHPIAVKLNTRFGLRPRLACEAINLAGDMKLLRRAMS